jgi:predicted ABC-type ATPase
MPTVFVIGGPNGAGKTTAAMRLVPRSLGLREYVNADAIAVGLSPFNPDRMALQAGRLMIERLAKLARDRTDFAFEATLAGRLFAPMLRKWQTEGYEVHVIYLWLQSVELAIARVAEAVGRGGHDIPVDVIRRRYEAGRRNFVTLYRPIADTWEAYDNSGTEPVLVAAGGRDEAHLVLVPETWQRIKEDCGAT